MSAEGRGLRVGIIGGGFMASVHAHATRAAGATLVAVAASTPARSKEAAVALGALRASSVEELVASDDIDVVHVCTPNATHVPFTLAALEQGKHVVCEKPIATTVTEADAVATAASTAGRLVTVPFVYRFHPLVREMRARLAGAQITTFHGQYLQDWLLADDDWNWRVDPGEGGASRAFADIGSHLVDLVEFVTDRRFSELTARKRTLHPERGGRRVHTEDSVAALAELEGGGIGTLVVSQVAPGRKNGLALEISTDEETLRFEQERPEELWIGRRRGSGLLMRDADELSPDAARLSVLPSGHPQGYQDAFNGFVADTYAAVRGDVRSGLPTVEDGVRAVTLTEIVMSSASRSSPLVAA